ncbi:response regulator [Marinilabiliaceae bacterium ANBcel2]|nr:response regulator [Marinilabiliaceae bacterium ANBcel2]
MVKSSDYILIIDDSQTNNVLLQAVLDEADYNTHAALSASEGWKLLHEQKPALILLDLLMPKISGFHFLDKVKTNSEYKDIPVIIVSALGDDGTIRVLKEKGAEDFFTKPLDIDRLLKRVSDFV